MLSIHTGDGAQGRIVTRLGSASPKLAVRVAVALEVIGRCSPAVYTPTALPVVSRRSTKTLTVSHREQIGVVGGDSCENTDFR